MPPRPRVLLADDHIPFLESVRRVLAPAFDIVAVAGDGRQALEQATRLRPDVVVLDVAMPGLNGFQTLDQLRRDCPGTRVVFLTMHQDDDFVVAAITAGAHGYVLKSRMTVHLCRNGDFEAALELERIWTEVTRALADFHGLQLPNRLLRAFRRRHHLSNVCAEHSAVTSGIFAQRSLDIN